MDLNNQLNCENKYYKFSKDGSDNMVIINKYFDIIKNYLHVSYKAIFKKSLSSVSEAPIRITSVHEVRFESSFVYLVNLESDTYTVNEKTELIADKPEMAQGISEFIDEAILIGLNRLLLKLRDRIRTDEILKQFSDYTI